MNLIKLLFASLVFSSLSSFAQQSISEKTKSELLKQNTELNVQIENLKNENEKHKRIVNIKENEISKLKKKIKYYKETLSLLSSKIEATDKNVNFKITSVNGNTNTGEIVIEGIAINKGILRTLQGKSSIIYDPKGNTTRGYKMSFGEVTRIEKFHKDIPTKFKLLVKEIVPKTPMLKSVNIEFYSTIGYKNDHLYIVFNNLRIKWK
ncbi:hypothetical protein [Polaribacter cellanae]|uniref:DUF3251 domain-containing protein n=1 Tax=Polaribacter cellanae TaxID=2818493 RepID=A0A975CMM4_9FLAO|nr:hypothetical protein [Polaribacter cellanae]QTE22015.1 hypothetical protein J3359_14530 [Polaribacter cellanae]